MATQAEYTVYASTDYGQGATSTHRYPTSRRRSAFTELRWHLAHLHGNNLRTGQPIRRYVCLSVARRHGHDPVTRIRHLVEAKSF